MGGVLDRKVWRTCPSFSRNDFLAVETPIAMFWGQRRCHKETVKDFAERSGELSGAICLQTLVLLGNDPANP